MAQSDERKYPLRMPPGWEPPVPAFMAKFNDDARQVSMVLLGCQFDGDNRAAAVRAVAEFAAHMRGAAADYVDFSECSEDSTGAAQLFATGYWFDAGAVDALFSAAAFRATWREHSNHGTAYGLIREVFNVPIGNYETLYSGPNHRVGVASVRTGVTEPIARHGYWGSMRDRMDSSASDPFEPSGDVTVLEQSENRLLVRANQNLAVIRSGQDLSLTDGVEREEYFADVEPSFRDGMNFLRDSGRDVNCYDCRTMRFVTEDGDPEDHTYGLAFFRSLEDLEQWAEHHPTHRAIFDSFLEFAPRYGPDMRIRLWHEVSVLPAENQFSEYINCRPGTGLTSALA